jgi:hypothetical protein
MRTAPTVLECAKGHTTSVQPWGVTPLCCPVCIHGMPCRLPLRPVTRKKAT